MGSVGFFKNKNIHLYVCVLIVTIRFERIQALCLQVLKNKVYVYKLYVYKGLYPNQSMWIGLG